MAFDPKDSSGINLKAFPQLLDNRCQYRGEDFKNMVMSIVHTSEKVKIIEVLCMKRNN